MTNVIFVEIWEFFNPFVHQGSLKSVNFGSKLGLCYYLSCQALKTKLIFFLSAEINLGIYISFCHC